MSDWNIPVIDLEPYWSGTPEGKASVAREVGWACENIGFLVIANHHVPQQLIDRAFAVSRAFFDLSTAEKSRFKPADGAAPRGYHALATRNLAKTLGYDTPPDLREQFYVGPLGPRPANIAAIPGAALYYMENIWPEQPAAYREVFTAFYSTMERLAAQLMRVFALALRQPEDFFDDKIDHHFNSCPANHYPVVDGDPLPGQIRAGAHSDFGSLTILAFNDAPGGLQVMMPDETWLDVSPAPGHLVVNLGDMMARWTNDRWKSTVHRVVNPPVDLRGESRRMTIGYFLHPNYDAEISCLESCCDSDNPPKYPPIMAGDQMREKMERRAQY